MCVCLNVFFVFYLLVPSTFDESIFHGVQPIFQTVVIFNWFQLNLASFLVSKKASFSMFVIEVSKVSIKLQF